MLVFILKIPPMPDENHPGSLLVDGAYVNNFPVEHVRAMGASWTGQPSELEKCCFCLGIVISVDVASEFNPIGADYGDCLSGVPALVGLASDSHAALIESFRSEPRHHSSAWTAVLVAVLVDRVHPLWGIFRSVSIYHHINNLF